MSSEKYLKRQIEGEKNLLGERLLIALGKLGKNQREFSESTGIPASTLSGIIKAGRSPTAEITKRMFDAGVNVNYLISGIGEPLLKNPESDSQTDANVPIVSMNDQSSGRLVQAGDTESRRQAILGVKKLLGERSMENRQEVTGPDVIEVNGKDFLDTIVTLVYNCSAEEIEMLYLMIKKRLREEFKRQV